MEETQKVKKCYNSFSCIFSVFIIVFVLGSIVWDLCITKPHTAEAINEINTELQQINQRLDNSYLILRGSSNPMFASDSIFIEELTNNR